MRVSAIWILLTLLMVGCGVLAPETVWLGRPGSFTRLVNDSPGVRQMIAEASWRDEEAERSLGALPDQKRAELVKDMLLHPDRYVTERRKLLAEMARQPASMVAGRQDAIVIGRSEARCGGDPVDTNRFIKVRVSTGPSTGTEGWYCQGSDVEVLSNE